MHKVFLLIHRTAGQMHVDSIKISLQTLHVQTLSQHQWASTILIDSVEEQVAGELLEMPLDSTSKQLCRTASSPLTPPLSRDPISMPHQLQEAC